MKFFVPYNMIEFFNSKSSKTGGVFRHVQAQRIYLYILHKNSGRLSENDLKSLSIYFNTSVQNIKKSISTLMSWGLVSVSGNYFTAKGKDEFSKINNSNYFRTYAFTEESLKDSKLFKTLIFKYIGQEVATKKGQKFSQGLHIKRKKQGEKAGQYFVTNAIRDNADKGLYTSNQSDSLYNGYLLTSETFNPTITEVVQKQSLSYLGKANKRSSRTISRKLKQAESMGEIKIVHKKAKTLSTCCLEHHKYKEETLLQRPLIKILESEEKCEVVEMLETFKRKFPILGQDTFVSTLDTGFCAFKRQTNKIYYRNIDLNSKTINKGNPNWKKGSEGIDFRR